MAILEADRANVLEAPQVSGFDMLPGVSGLLKELAGESVDGITSANPDIFGDPTAENRNENVAAGVVQLKEYAEDIASCMSRGEATDGEVGQFHGAVELLTKLTVAHYSGFEEPEVTARRLATIADTYNIPRDSFVTRMLPSRSFDTFMSDWETVYGAVASAENPHISPIYGPDVFIPDQGELALLTEQAGEGANIEEGVRDNALAPSPIDEQTLEVLAAINGGGDAAAERMRRRLAHTAGLHDETRRNAESVAPTAPAPGDTTMAPVEISLASTDAPKERRSFSVSTIIRNSLNRVNEIRENRGKWIATGSAAIIACSGLAIALLRSDSTEDTSGQETTAEASDTASSIGRSTTERLIESPLPQTSQWGEAGAASPERMQSINQREAEAIRAERNRSIDEAVARGTTVYSYIKDHLPTPDGVQQAVLDSRTYAQQQGYTIVIRGTADKWDVEVGTSDQNGNFTLLTGGDAVRVALRAAARTLAPNVPPAL